MSGAELASVFRAIVRGRDALARLKSTLPTSRGVTAGEVARELDHAVRELVALPVTYGG